MTMITYPQPNKLISFLTYALIVLSVSFSLLPAELNWGNVTPEGSYTQGSLVFQIQFGSIFLVGAIIAFYYRDWTFLKLRHINPCLLLLVTYCIITMLWSPYPVITFKRSCQLIGLIVVGLVISPPTGKPRQLIYTLLATFTVIMMLSMIIVLIMPSIGIDYELDNAWRGILSQKNSLGVVAALSVIFWAREIMDKQLPTWLCILGFLFSTFMLIMTKSTTALIVCMFCVGCYFFIRKRHFFGDFDYIKIFVSLLTIVLTAVWIFYLFNGHLPTWQEIFAPIGAVFDKSTDLTGRTEIWALVLLSIKQHPIFGIGYGAFWLGEGSPSQYIINVLHWIPLQSHNGYLDILNELGITGLILLIGVFIFHAINLFKFLKIDREEAAIHWSIFIFILISHISESEIFRGVLFQNIFFLYSSITVSSRIALARYERMFKINE